MNLKKCLLASAILSTSVLACSVNAAMIDRVDLTSILGASGDNVTNVNFGDVDGGALVFQTASGPGDTLQVGDTFTESGALEVTNWNSTPLPGGEIASGLGLDYELFLRIYRLDW